MRDNNIRDYETLSEKADEASSKFDELSSAIKEKEAKLKRIGAIRMNIINYAKTRETYVKYRESGYSKKFYEAHREEITVHQAAKKAFDAMSPEEKPNGKLPTVKQLSTEYAEVLAEKKKLYGEYRLAKKNMADYVKAKRNIGDFLAMDKEPERSRDRGKRYTER